MLTCRQLTDNASDYLEGPSTFGQRMAMRLHLLICKHCRRYYRQLQLVIRIAPRLPEPPSPSEDDINKLIRQLKDIEPN